MTNQSTCVLYEVEGRIARVTLNRPERLNAIDLEMPGAISEAIDRANNDPAVHVIILSGKGASFCAGYDLTIFAESPRPCPGSQLMPWDPMIDFDTMIKATQQIMSIWRSHKPVIGKIRGHAIAGGSDIALCCDVLIMSEDAVIGYPPARVWGCSTTALWIYRIGVEHAKRLLLTGDTISGKEAHRIGLVSETVPEKELDKAVDKLAARMAGVPKNQLMMHKLLLNQSLSNMGLESTQLLATLFDGIARHTPEGIAFKEKAEKIGFKEAVKERDKGNADLVR